MTDAAQAIRRAPERREVRGASAIVGNDGYQNLNAGAYSIQNSDFAYRFTSTAAPLATSYTANTLR